MAASKRAKKTRTESEFDIIRLAAALRPPLATSNAYAWSLEQIRIARDDQLRGVFRLPARMAESMRTDDALFSARENRLAPQRCLRLETVPMKGARGESVANEADALFGQNGVGVTSDVRADINGTMADHGFAIGVCADSVRPDGSRVDKEMHAWPLEFVRWNPIDRCLMAQVLEASDAERSAHPDLWNHGSFEVPIVHGDGRWVIFQKHEFMPWKQDACILAGSMVWARHAYANRDWAKGSGSHGNSKVVGEMPEGISLQDKDGGISPEAAAFLALLQAMVSPDAMAGIRPAGGKTDYLTNNSTAWQVWSELVTNAEKAAARIYLGTDGMLGSVGGAPGVDIATLFGVATTKVQGDLDAIERGINTGVIEPWCAENFGDSTLAPKVRYVMPNTETLADAENYGKRSTAFYLEIASAKAAGFTVDQPFVEKLAKRYGVDAPPMLGGALPAATSVGKPVARTPMPAAPPEAAVAPPATAAPDRNGAQPLRVAG